MSLFEKIFLYYSAILAIFATFSAGFPLQLIFLPLPIYFGYIIFSQIKRRKEPAKSLEHTPLGKKMVLVSLAIFLMLLGMGVINISKPQAEKQGSSIVAEQKTNSPEEPQEATASAQQSPSKESVEVKVDEDSFVNVREQPDKLSKIIGIAKNGQRYPFLGAQGDWYEIIFDEKHDFINKEFATTNMEN